ncbi:MAG: DUF3325 family protein [Pseudomonadota bacterium]
MSLVIGILCLALAFLSAFAGCTLLALSQGRNWRLVSGAYLPDTARRLARFLGCSLSVVSLGICIFLDGGSFAALLWPLLLAAAALLLAMVIAYWPTALKPIVLALKAGKSI